MINIRPEEIVRKITNLSGFDPYENTRKRNQVEVRALACYLMREKLNMRWTNITKVFEDNGKQMHHASAIHLVKNYKFYKLANKDLQKYEDSFNFLQGLDYEEVNRISFLEDKLSALQDKYDTLEENLQHPLVKLVADITDEKNKWELADQIVIVKKSWAWKNKTNLNVI